MVDIQIGTEGFEDVLNKISDPEITRTPVRGLLLTMGNRGRKVAQRASEGGEGMIPQTIVRFYDRQKITVTIKSAIENTPRKVPRLLSIEEGRPAGGPLPNTMIIAKWMRSAGLSTEAKAVSEMAHMMRREGTEGKHMFEQAYLDITFRMHRYVKRAVRNIEKRWSKKYSRTIDLSGFVDRE